MKEEKQDPFLHYIKNLEGGLISPLFLGYISVSAPSFSPPFHHFLSQLLILNDTDINESSFDVLPNKKKKAFITDGITAANNMLEEYKAEPSSIITVFKSHYLKLLSDPIYNDLLHRLYPVNEVVQSSVYEENPNTMHAVRILLDNARVANKTSDYPHMYLLDEYDSSVASQLVLFNNHDITKTVTQIEKQTKYGQAQYFSFKYNTAAKLAESITKALNKIDTPHFSLEILVRPKESDLHAVLLARKNENDYITALEINQRQTNPYWLV